VDVGGRQVSGRGEASTRARGRRDERMIWKVRAGSGGGGRRSEREVVDGKEECESLDM